MQRFIPPLLIAVALFCNPLLAQDTSDLVGSWGYQRSLSVSDTLSALSRIERVRQGPGAGGGGMSGTARAREVAEPLLSQLNDLLKDSAKLTQAVAKAQKLPIEKVKFVPPNDWTATAFKKDDGNFYITVTPSFETQNLSPAAAFNIFGYTLRCSPPIPSERAQAITKAYNEALSEDARKISEKFFADKVDPLFTTAKTNKEAVLKKVADLEAERRSLQIHAAEQLPYEKVVDRLADLQRQMLALKLAIVGMDAKEREIANQRLMIDRRLQDQAVEAAKAASSDEMIDTLKQLVKLRTDHADFVKQQAQAGTITSAEAGEAAAKLLDAKVQLLTLVAKKQPQLNRAQLDALDDERTRIEIDRKEASAKYSFLENVYAEVTEQISRRSDLDLKLKRIDEELPAEKTRLRTASSRLGELEDLKANFKPIDLTTNGN